MTVAKPSARRRWLAAAWGAGVAGAMGAALPGMARATPAAKGEPVAWPEVRLLDGSLLPAPSARSVGGRREVPDDANAARALK
jgi:hypothetical protein